MNVAQLVRDFVQSYYSKMSSGSGLSSLLNIFDQNSQIIFNSQEFTGAYNLLQYFASKNVQTILYDNYNYSFMILDNNTILIHVSGTCSTSSFWNHRSTRQPFSDTFVNYYNGNMTITKMMSYYA